MKAGEASRVTSGGGERGGTTVGTPNIQEFIFIFMVAGADIESCTRSMTYQNKSGRTMTVKKVSRNELTKLRRRRELYNPTKGRHKYEANMNGMKSNSSR